MSKAKQENTCFVAMRCLLGVFAGKKSYRFKKVYKKTKVW
jgi:hypothetical protein